MRDLLPTIARQPYSYRSDPTAPAFPDDKPLIVFDGYCGLCSRLVQFTLRRDPAARYRFLPAQTALGDALYLHYGLDPSFYETFILLRDGRAYFASEAAIELVRDLGFPWSLAPLLRVVPKVVRDWLYLRVAHNRMRFFGRTEACYMPSSANADRFIDGGARTEVFQDQVPT
jgi:predicted DCC family thiol-disulfide oxidoreductase YuxK